MRSSFERRCAAFIYAADAFAAQVDDDARARLACDLVRATRVLLRTPDSEAALAGCTQLLVREALALSEAVPAWRDALLDLVTSVDALRGADDGTGQAQQPSA